MRSTDLSMRGSTALVLGGRGLTKLGSCPAEAAGCSSGRIATAAAPVLAVVAVARGRGDGASDATCEATCDPT